MFSPIQLVCPLTYGGAGQPRRIPSIRRRQPLSHFREPTKTGEDGSLLTNETESIPFRPLRTG